MLSLVVALALSADAGPGTTYARQLIDRLFQAQHAEQKRDAIAALKIASAAATGADRTLVNRMLAFVEADAPPEQAFVELADIVRALMQISRGRFDEERQAHAAFLSLQVTAEAVGRDPQPIRKEAVERMRDLAARYPNEGRAHGLLASALQAARAEPKEWTPPLERCAALAPASWCAEHVKQLKAEAARPRCSGAQLTKPLTMAGENEPPFLTSKDFAVVTIDGDGNLALETTPDARARLEAETRRLLGKPVALKRGGDVLLSAVVQTEIKEGRIRVSPGKGRKGFDLSELCSSAP